MLQVLREWGEQGCQVRIKASDYYGRAKSGVEVWEEYACERDVGKSTK